MPPPQKKRTKPKRRKNTSASIKFVGLKPFRENMGTGESYSPKRSPRKKTSRTPPPRRHVFESIPALELERLPPRNHVLFEPEPVAVRLLQGVVQYGLLVFLVLTLCTLVAWYVHEKNTGETVRMIGYGRDVAFQVGDAIEHCRVVVETRPTSSELAVNGQPILSRTPVQLLLPCRKTATIAVRESGYIPAARIIRAEDRQVVSFPMHVGISTFVDEFKFNFLNALHPILSAIGW